MAIGLLLKGSWRHSARRCLGNSLKRKVDEGTSMNLDKWTTYLALLMQVVSRCKFAQVKSSFLCKRRQISGRHWFFNTFAPFVNLTTEGLILILSVNLGLANKQVDNTTAFLHAPINFSRSFKSLSEEEMKQPGVYVAMLQGFTRTGKFLKLKV